MTIDLWVSGIGVRWGWGERRGETNFILSTINFPNRNFSISINLVSRRMLHLTLQLLPPKISVSVSLRLPNPKPKPKPKPKPEEKETNAMSPRSPPPLRIFQTTLTDPQFPFECSRILLRKRSSIPSINLIRPKLNRCDWCYPW